MMRRIPSRALHAGIAAIFRAAGSDAAEAEAMADHLVGANLAGHDSHGAIRVPKYLEWAAAGLVVPNRHAQIVTDSGALLVVDGDFGYGQVIGAEATAMAAARARVHGVCVMALRNAGHLGRIGTYPEQLAAEGLASVHFVNTSGFGILVAPFGATDRRLSTNPVAGGAPGPDGPIILDMATSASAEGKVQVARNKGETLPHGVLLDQSGAPSTDPAALYTDPPGALLPLGGHKGSGLSILCEIMAGSLTGGGASHPHNPSARRVVNNMLSVVLDPGALGAAGGFEADIERLSRWVRGARRADPDTPVLLPGEPERRHRMERLRDGILLDDETLRQLNEAAAAHGVAFTGELAM